MRAIPLLLGSLLGFGVIASATATNASAASGMSALNCTGGHAMSAGGHAGSADAAPSNGDAPNFSRIAGSSTTEAPGSSHADSHHSAASASPAHFDSGDAAPTTSSSPSSGLGWQSLLPGSIQ